MPIAMAEDPNEGAPIAKDAIDPELVRLARTRPKVSVITAAGLVFLCLFFVIKLNADRSFGGSGEPRSVAIADLAAGKVEQNGFVKIANAELLMSHALRTSTSPNGIGLRVVPVRGTNEKLWIAMNGDGWDVPKLGLLTGRVKKLADLPFWKTISKYGQEHPRPVFAPPSALKAGNKVTAVTGETVELADGDKVAYDTTDTEDTLLVGTLNDRLPSKDAWQTELGKAGIQIKQALDVSAYTARFIVVGTQAAITPLLDKANLLGPVRLEAVSHHTDTTWGAFKAAPPSDQVDLVGLYVMREIPADAYALITDEHPEDYWYVLPITIALGVLGLVFAWALVRAVKRDLLPTRA
ncbi:MAG: hypothetical protein QM831_18725 [Kofleriaceae bacterium]